MRGMLGDIKKVTGIIEELYHIEKTKTSEVFVFDVSKASLHLFWRFYSQQTQSFFEDNSC